jgi:hypothetical protein
MSENGEGSIPTEPVREARKALAKLARGDGSPSMGTHVAKVAEAAFASLESENARLESEVARLLNELARVKRELFDAEYNFTICSNGFQRSVEDGNATRRELAGYREVVDAARKVAPRGIAMHKDYSRAEWWKVPGADLEALARALASLSPTPGDTK